ncbi:MAG TPA: cell division protein ZapA [Firmicutes bacterium]|nr:cell division protein ZapA [Bacillota bacterium]HHY99393.1 cell division protein ZapA [Bacillota bacterium]
MAKSSSAQTPAGGPEVAPVKKSRVAVRIMSDEYTIVGDADPEYIKELAAEVDSRIRQALEANRKLARAQAAILTCLNMADELHKLKAQYEELVQLIEGKR